MKDHSFYMHKCFNLAKKAIGQTSPNPYVGSVIVNQTGDIIAEGFHKKSGTDHAERDAIKNAPQNVEGMTLYCNLEPCCHTNKKTPPCAQFIIESGIKKVVIANLDPNPNVAGKGVKLLEDAGIEVIVGIEEDYGLKLNEVFFYHIQNKRPFVHLKWAQTLDGKVATTSFDSKWITGDLARNYVHQERNLYDAILVGANTVIRDNPRLTTRIHEEKCPVRIILSPSGNLDFSANVFTDKFKDKTLVVTKPGTNVPNDINKLESPLIGETFDMQILMHNLYDKGISSVYVEGGSKVINSFLFAKNYQRLSVYTAPKILGKGLNSVHLLHFDNMQDSLIFENGVWSQKGIDMLFENSRNICLQD